MVPNEGLGHRLGGISLWDHRSRGSTRAGLSSSSQVRGVFVGVRGGASGMAPKGEAKRGGLPGSQGSGARRVVWQPAEGRCQCVWQTPWHLKGHWDRG